MTSATSHRSQRASLRVWRALVAKELRLVLASRGILLLQIVLLSGVGLSVGLLVMEHVRSGQRSWEEVALTALPTFFAVVGSALFFVVPALTVGALQDEKERGMLEVLATTPVQVPQLFGALMAARLLIVLIVCFTVAPLLAILGLEGGVLPWDIVVRGAAMIFLGVTLVTLFAMRLVALGQGPAQVWTRVVIFVVFTPFAWGGQVFVRIMTVLILALIVYSFSGFLRLPPAVADGLGFLMLLLLGPFIALLRTLFDVTDPVAIGAIWLTFLVTIGVYYYAAVDATHGWVKRQLVPNIRRLPKGRHWDEEVRRESMERLEQTHSGEVPLDSDVESWLLARRVLNGLGPIALFFVRWSNRSPFLIRHHLVRSSTGIIAWTGAFFAMSLLISTLPRPPAPSVQMSWVASILTASVALVTALCGASLFPPQRARVDDPLLSAPLTGRRIVSAVLALFLFASWPLFFSGFVTIAALFVFDPRAVVPAISALCSLFGSAALIFGVVLWVARLWHQWAQRFGVAIVSLGVLAFVQAQVDLLRHVDPILVAACRGLFGLTLLAAFAILHDKVTGRSRSRFWWLGR